MKKGVGRVFQIKGTSFQRWSYETEQSVHKESEGIQVGRSETSMTDIIKDELPGG